MSRKADGNQLATTARTHAPEGLMEFSRFLESWLLAEIADDGTHVDAGFGPEGRDLWVTVRGQEFVIKILQCEPRVLHTGVQAGASSAPAGACKSPVW